MRTRIGFIIACVITVLIYLAVGQSHARELPPTQPTTFPSIRDAGTNVVVSFYRVLLQEQPPTMADEAALLLLTSSPRMYLIEQARKGTANDPVAMTWFRSHKDWFVPANMGQPGVVELGVIDVTSTFDFVQVLDRELVQHRRHPDQGFVLVMFPDVFGAQVSHDITIVFSLAGGKIDLDRMQIGGFGGEYILDRVGKEYPMKHPND